MCSYGFMGAREGPIMVEINSCLETILVNCKQGVLNSTRCILKCKRQELYIEKSKLLRQYNLKS